MRIGVLGLFRPTELAVRPSPQAALVIEGDGHQLILADSREARLRVAGKQVECEADGYIFRASLIRGENRQGGSADFIVSIPGKIARQYRGSLEVNVSEAKLLPVVAMDLETAVASAVAAESPSGATLEALKAQAIVTRSYYIAARRRHNGFNFCDTTHCQFLREPPAADSPATIAAVRTRGLVLTYRGEVFPALFSASCGGRTRALAEIGLSPQGYPYYSVRCEYCLQHTSQWESSLDIQGADDLLEGEPTEAKRLKIDRKMGWSAIPGNNYELNLEGETIVIRGRGQGHGIGLCQLGASHMAAEGKAFQDILNYYYPNASISAADN